VLAREGNRPREREVGGLGPVGIAGGLESEEVLAGGELVIDIGHTIAAGGRSKYVVVHRPTRRQPQDRDRRAHQRRSRDAVTPCSRQAPMLLQPGDIAGH
jgi:hypothetical protein